MHGSLLDSLPYILPFFATVLQGVYHNPHLIDGEAIHIFRKTLIKYFLFDQKSQTSMY